MCDQAMKELPPGVRPHVPRRPLWLCRACADVWPCPTARLKLKAVYGDDRAGLCVLLCGLLYEAIEDLHRLNPRTGPSPQGLFDRLVGWAAPRSHVD
ncbi:hypothetical protein [Micromonospora zhanjiangensis]|uniref:Flavin reductase n=1 Tax=Micromonospora zhanjiangensis TaxID=1522057 RepID=A0ABV8KLB2_9ACTN